MSTPIFIVQGHTGEYSDHVEWLVRAYRTEAEAQAEVERLCVIYRAIFGVEVDQRPHPIGHYPSIRLQTEAMREHDPGFTVDYTGAGWDVLETLLTDTVP